MDELQIQLAAIIDEVKSLLGMQKSLEKMGEKLSVPVSAKLDRARSRAQLKADLATLEKLSVKLTGKLNRSETRKTIKDDVKAIEGEKVKLKAVVDSKTVKKSLEGVNDKSVNVSAKVDGTDNVKKLEDGMSGVNRVAPSAVGNVILLNKAISGLERAAREMVETAAELDEKLTDLRMVTGDSYDDAKALVDSYNDLAKELGATTAEVLDASSEWLRQGMSTQDTAKLIEQSMVLSKVGAMDAATATENLTSAMKGYGLAVEDVSGIVDKLTAIDLQAAVSSSDLAVGMSRTATSANIAGVSMDRLLGYLAVVQETTQKSAETIGESFKTIFARIGNVKLGNYIDDNGEDLSDVETVLKHFGIALRDAQGDFRNTSEVLDELYQKWNKFSSVDKRAVANAFAGTRQQENFLVLMENYAKALEYTEVAADSAGTALEKFGAYQESLQAKMNSFTAAFESLSMNTLDADFLGALIDAGTAMLQFADNTNLLKIALSGLAAAGAVKGITALTTTIKGAYDNVSKLSTAFDMLSNAGSAGISAQQFEALLSVTDGLNASQLRLIVTNKALTNEQRLALLTARGLTAEEAAQTLATLGLSTAEATATTATFSLSGAFKALTAAIAANPIGFLVVALTTAVTIISSVVSKVKQAEEEARQAAIAAGEAAAESAQKLTDLATSYLELSYAVEAGTGSEKDFMSMQDELVAYLKDQGAVVDNLTDSYADLRESIIEAARTQLQTDISQSVRAADVAKDNAVDELDGYFAKNDFYSATGKEAGKAMDYLKELGFTGIDNSSTAGGGTIFLPSVYSTGGGLEDVKFEDLTANYKYLQQAMNAVREQFGSENPVFTILADAYNEYDAALKDAVAQIDNTNQMVAQDALLAAQQLAKPTDFEEFEQFRRDMIDRVQNSLDFDANGTYSAEALVDKTLSSNSYYADYLTELNQREEQAKQVSDKMQAISEALIPPTYKNYEEGTSAHFHELDAWAAKAEEVKEKLRGLSDEDFNIAYNFVVSGDVSDVDELQNAIDALDLTKKMSSKQIDEYRDLVDNYNDVLSEADSLGIDLSRTVYGNIDTNNRQILQWTDESLATYKDAIESWGMTVDELRGSFSTVVGSSEEFDGVEIAFSPMLQTENGAVLLDYNTVSEYIYGLIDKAGENWNSEDLLRLDTEGLEIDGQIIKNLIADIGDTAIETGAAMHFAGNVGAVAEAYDALSEAAEKAGTSVGALQFYFSHAISKYDTRLGDE